MKQQFLDLTGLTELVAYIKSNVTDKKEILPYASNKLFPSTGDINAIYIDTATNTIYRWDTSSKTYKILAQAVKSISISESTENGKITLTVDGVKTTVPIHGLKSAAFTESSAYSPADHTHTKAQIGLGSVDNTADKDKSVKHANTADSATTAGTATTATNVNGENATADAARHVWFSDSATETKRNYNDKFKYNPATNTVTTNISGSAASANSVLWSGVTNKPSTFTPSAHNHDDSTITSLNASKLFGTIDIARLPHGALERLVIVADDTARFKLTTANVQLGDTVKVIKTEKMYYVVDESKLSSEAGYSVYTAGTATSVPWSGVTGKPSSYPPASHNHDERYYTETEMNSKLAEKAPKVHTHVKSEVGLGNVDNTADANKSVKYAASAGTATKANAVPWSGITDKPSTYPPSSHTHDDRYYTESEINANVYRLKTFDIIPANANLNTYITPGTYGQSTGSTAQTIKNLPYSNSPYEFKLIVEYYFSNSSQYIMQRLYRWRSTEYYIRESTDSGASWLAWRKFANSDETLLRSGGTMTGALHIMQPGSGSYNENIRIHPSTAGWTSIVMCGTDNTGDSGTSAKTWGLYTSEGQFAIAKNGNGLTSGTASLKCDNNNSWTINGSTILNSSNYTSYTTTKTGGGASGTWGISITGNAATATKLATARSINGTNFDGSGSITTATWGTARNITIGSTKKSVNGGADVSWSLGEIGAAASSHTHAYLPLAGGTMTGVISSSVATATHLAGNKGTVIINSIAADGYNMLARMKSTNGVWTLGNYTKGFHLYYTADSTISAGTNTVTKDVVLLNESGDSAFPGTVTAAKFSGPLNGNASSASSVPWTGVTGRPSSLPASDVYAWAKASTKPSYTKAEVGLGNVDNTADSAKSVKYATSAGSASSATKATQDSAGQQINTTYVKSLSVSGRTITITKGNGTTSTITTQDTNTDTKVTQTAIKSSDYTNWRTIPWGSSNSGSEGFTPTTVTDVMYSDPNLTYQPSSGTLRAKTFKGTLNGTAYEANLAWGGHNFAGSYGPIDAAMIPTLGANRLAFIPPESITVTYSRDGGSTWSDYGASSDTKRGLFSTGSNLTIGKADSTNKATANSTKYQLRITIDTDKASVYTILNKFAISVSTNGSNSCWCTIDASLEKTPTTWVNFAKQVSVSGWSGWNIINTDGLTTYGNNPSVQYGLVRFTFGANGGSTTYTGLQVLQILGFGGFGWSTPSNMARTGHLYSYDTWQNAFFPAQVNANNMLMNTCVNCSNWNDAVKTGWYMASGASNAPTSGAWYFGMVIAHNGNYVIQELYQFTASTDAKSIPKYIRAKMNGTWGSWTDVTVQVKVPSGAKFTDTNTWRPLGTTGDTACAGNDSRLSNARPASDVYAWAKASSKPSYSWGEITGKPSTFTPASHTHNYAGSSSAGGNANAAVKLATARSINGTNFDGSGNITTANWGTARTITVGNTGKSVNGSGNVSWSLGEIGVHVSNKQPTASDGKNGDVWIVYEG